MMKPTGMWRGVQIAIVVAGMTVQVFPTIAWAQLGDVDPALDAAVEALILHDPTIANDPELAQLCRQIAEATVVDPRERAAVTNEVIAMHREGVDINTVIPTEVREAAREEFTKVQGQMKEQLETLRATDPERAKEVEFMMRESERQMAAFESGEHYTPSPEMVEHAQGMFKEWESDMVANGAPPEFVERARMEFAMWSSGDMAGMMGGPGQDMMGPGGPGHEGGMPSLEQMQAMVDAGKMTPEQLQMAKDYMQNGSFEGGYPMMDPSGNYPMMDPSGNYPMIDSGNYPTAPDPSNAPTPPENGVYDSNQAATFDTTQPPPAEYRIADRLHVADHNGDGDAIDPVDFHPHEIYRHTQGTGDLTDDTCHDHTTGDTVGC